MKPHQSTQISTDRIQFTLPAGSGRHGPSTGRSCNCRGRCWSKGWPLVPKHVCFEYCDGFCLLEYVLDVRWIKQRYKSISMFFFGKNYSQRTDMCCVSWHTSYLFIALPIPGQNFSFFFVVNRRTYSVTRLTPTMYVSRKLNRLPIHSRQMFFIM
jgi:hypothetical protein